MQMPHPDYRILDLGYDIHLLSVFLFRDIHGYTMLIRLTKRYSLCISHTNNQ